MKVLVLGGSVFLSRAVAQAHRARADDVTCLVRNADGRLPAGLRAVSADRALGTSAYDEVRGSWDAVVDVATDPRFVRDALEVLGERAHHWTYVSSCSVYRDQDHVALDESSATVEPIFDGDARSPENYAAAKSACESLCRDARGERLSVVRPGLIVGAGDPSDRGGYWPMRFVRDDLPVLVPTAASCAAQMIDVRDVAQWIARCNVDALTGVFNAVGDVRGLRELLEETRSLLGHRGAVVEAADDWLLERGVSPWSGPESLPLWIPTGTGLDGFQRRSNATARAHAMSLRPLGETIAEIVAHERERGFSRERAAGLSARREGELLVELGAFD